MKSIRYIYAVLFSLLIAVILLVACANNGKTKIPVSDIGKEVICPVTGEKFKITKHTPFVDYQGKRYYFCCPGCDKQFLKEPQKYLKESPPDTIKEHLKQVQSESSKVQGDTTEIIYYTCSMHPSVRSDKPGKCPICGMELIPVYKGSENRIVVDKEKLALMGIKTTPVEKRQLVKKVQLPARISKDEELYLLQQELVSARQGNSELLDATILKLKLLGFSQETIEQMIAQKTIDKSLLIPNPHRAWLIAELYEQDIPLVKPGVKANIKFSAYPDKEISGIVMAIEPQINPQTRSAKARIIINYPGVNLFSEMYGEAIIEIVLGKILSIPYSSLIDTGKRKVVYVEKSPGTYEIRNVTSGIETDEYVQVLSGLKEGEMVVAEGNFLLDSQTTLAGGQSLLYGSAQEIKESDKVRTPHNH